MNLLCTAHHTSRLRNIQDRIQNTEYKLRNTKYRIKNTETDLHKITNVPAFYMELILNDLDGGKSNSRAIGRGGP
jgi:hypothetical protein